MDNNCSTVLVVDDDKFNLDLIEEYLSDDGIKTVCVDNGYKALSLLRESPHKYCTVILDWMMPGLSGIEVLTQIQSDGSINKIPVIMQTAKTGDENMLEGLNAGAHYYLSKPYGQKTLNTIVKTAIKDYQLFVDMQEKVQTSVQSLKMLHQGKFIYRTLKEARKLAVVLANACPKPETVVMGLTELMINAVEHGNLGVGYDEKTQLNNNGTWEDVIQSRLDSQEGINKNVTVDFTRSDNEISFLISDEGNGFKWKEYMDMSPERAFDNHGRGIALANSISFENIKYLGNGNQVCATVHLQ